MAFQSIDPNKYTGTPFASLGQNWALLTAGSPEHYNAMTVSWGAIGELWGRHVVFVFVRPQRYTYGFCETHDRFTLSLLPAGYKKELSVFGKKSGRDCDKFAETGLTPVSMDGTVFCGEAQTVFILQKLAAFDFDPSTFIDKSILPENYPNRDFHRVYVGEIMELLEGTVKED